MFFPNTLPKVIFGGSKRRSIPKSSILERFWATIWPKGEPFSAQKTPKGLPGKWRKMAGSVEEPTWSRFCAENGPRTHFHWFGCRFWLILVRFGIILGGFSMIFHRLLMWFLSEFEHQVFLHVFQVTFRPDANEPPSQNNNHRASKPSGHKPQIHSKMF